MFGLSPCSAWRIGSVRSGSRLLAIGFANNCSGFGPVTWPFRSESPGPTGAPGPAGYLVYEQLFAFVPGKPPGWSSSAATRTFLAGHLSQRQQIFLYHLILFLLTVCKRLPIL